MRILIATAGSRAQQWDGLFTALVARTDIDLSVFVADASAQTDRQLGDLADRHPHFQYHSARGLFGERLVGHRALALVPPGGGRVLAAWRPDVLHLLLTAGHALTAQVLRWRRRYWPDTPVTLYAGHPVATRFPQPLRRWERRVFETVACAFPTTPAAEDVLRTKGYAGPAHVVPLGVDTAAFQPAVRRRQQSFTVGFVGDLEPDTGVLELLGAGERLGCELLIVGSGSLASDIRRALASQRCYGTLRDSTRPEDLPALLASMDVLALPASTSRSVSCASDDNRLLVEAMSGGVPIVASETGTASRLVGPAGLPCRAGDAADLAGCLRRLRDEPGLTARLGAAGRSRADLFGWWRVADNLCAHWHALVDSQPPGVGPFPRTTQPIHQLGTTPASRRTQE